MRKLLIVPCLLISFSGPALAASAQVAGIHAPASIALTDLNHDGIPDVVNSTASGLFVQLGIGDGRFKPPIKVLESNLSFES